jgi:hypothetical protein
MCSKLSSGLQIWERQAKWSAAAFCFYASGAAFGKRLFGVFGRIYDEGMDECRRTAICCH